MGWLRAHAWTVAPLIAAAVGLLALYDLGARPWLTLAVLAGAVAAFVLAVVRVGGSAVPTRSLLAVAALLRCCLAPIPLTLSDDVWRYVWDGRVVLAGWNPYFHAPDDPALQSLRDEVWRRVDHRGVETVYPPLAIAAFSIAASTARPVLAWKALLVTIDLVSCLLLARLALLRGVPTGRVIAYAWNPLVVLEVAGMGHVDALGVAALLGAALLLERGRLDRGALPMRLDEPPSGRSGAAVGALLGLAIVAKLVPLLIVPAWTRCARRRAALVFACAAVVAAAAAPFVARAGEVPPGLVTYAVSWEFNGPIFEPLWRALDRVGTADHVKSWLARIEDATGAPERLAWLYHYVYPQLLAKALLSVALSGVVVWSLRSRDVVGAALLVFGGMLLLSATVYPWYLLWVLPWAAIAWSVPWLVLSATLLLAYVPRLLDVPLLPWPFLLVWSPFLAATAARTLLRRASPTA